MLRLKTFAQALIIFMLVSPAGATLLTDGDALGTSGWVVENIGDGMTLDFTGHTPASANSGTIGELVVTLDHPDFLARSFRLRQTTPADEIETSTTSGGLRLLMDLSAENGSAAPWVGYLIMADDRSHVDPTGLSVGSHLQDAHFHDSNVDFGSTGLTLAGDGDNVTQLTFGSGNIAVGDFFTVNNILVHERYFKGVQRTFDINFQPVPEPSVMLWTASGLAALAAAGWRRSRRRAV